MRWLNISNKERKKENGKELKVWIKQSNHTWQEKDKDKQRTRINILEFSEL
jgi:hypothetical protein